MASTIFLAASSKFSAEINFSPELSKISFPSLKFVPANLTTKGIDKIIFLPIAEFASSDVVDVLFPYMR